MKIIKKVLGSILYGITKAISFILDILISVINFFVKLVNAITNGFRMIIGMGGCLIFFLLAGPFGIYIFTNPYVLLTILFLVVFPLLGTKFVSLLKYVKYTFIEYLSDLSKYLREGTRGYSRFSEYNRKYRREEEAKRRREQQERQEQQQREWEEKFRQWQEYQKYQGPFGQGPFGQGPYGQGTYGSYGRYSDRQAYSNPVDEFKKKYEDSCNLLGVPYNADKYQIKLAFRKKAKEYHPDLNKAANATEMFQKINEAYDFLSDSNLERYRHME
mgnify:CR=1 FL=1